MSMQKTRGLVPFGLRDGRLWYVTEVETGLACDCICPDPACAKPLVARNKASPIRRRIYHFKHASQTVGCGGRESALHRMGKSIVENATRLQLPAWSACHGDLQFDSMQAVLALGSAQEVVLKEGQMRPDVKVVALASTTAIPSLYVEIRVSHAVDWDKRARVIEHGYSMIEIDLSDVADETLQNEEVFAQQVLDRLDNRRWIHLGSPAFLCKALGQEIVQITNTYTHEKRVPTKSGGHLLFKEQDFAAWRPESDNPEICRAELDDRIDGKQPVDAHGNHLPYSKGLYIRSDYRQISSWHHDFKTRLLPIVQDTPDNRQGKLGLRAG